MLSRNLHWVKMSWATIVDTDRAVLGDDGVVCAADSGEGALHSIRTAYNDAMQSLALAGDHRDARWVGTKQQLENVTTECQRYLSDASGTLVRKQIQEIRYLSNRNLINMISKCGTTGAACYPLALDTINTMLDLNKHDAALILLTARYAKQLGDWWTYKQLILVHQAAFPVMYRDLVIKEFDRNMRDKSAAQTCNLIDVNRLVVSAFSFDLRGRTLSSACALSFLEFLTRRLAALEASDISVETITVGFCLDWVVAVEDADREGSSTVGADAAPESAPMEVADSSGPTETPVDPVDVIISMPSEETPIEAEDCPQAEPHQLPAQSQPQVAAVSAVVVEATRASGRVVRRTAPALVAATEKEGSAALPLKGLSRASSQSQLSSEDEDFDEFANIHSIMKTLAKAQLEGASASGVTLSVHDAGYKALMYRFAVPVDAIISGTRTSPAVVDPADVRQIPSESLSQRGADTLQLSPAASLFPECKIVSLFAAYQTFVAGACDGNASPLLVNLFVRFIEVVSNANVETCAPLLIDAHLLCAAMVRCWQGLLFNYHGTRTDLLARLSDVECLTLLESSLSVIRSHRSALLDADSSVTVDRSLVAAASELVVSLLQRVLSRARAHRDAPFWAGFSTLQAQVRAIWAAVLSCRLFPDDSLLCEGSHLLQLLTTLKALLQTDPCCPLKLFLPHVAHSSSQLIDAQACDRLLNSFQYEAEVQTLLDTFAASKTWVAKALQQVSRSKSLSSYLEVPDQQKGGGDSASSVGGSHRTVPSLLLDACGALGSWSTCDEVLATLLQVMVWEVTELVATKPQLDATTIAEEFAWVDPFLTKIVATLSTLKVDLPVETSPLEDPLRMSVHHRLAQLVHMFGTHGLQSHVAADICMSCHRVFDSLASVKKSPEMKPSAAVNPAFLHASVAVLVQLSVEHLLVPHEGRASSMKGKAPLIIIEMWRFLDIAFNDGAVALASIPSPARDFLLVLSGALYTRYCADMPPQFRTALVSVLSQVATVSATLTAGEKAHILSHCSWELLDHALHIANTSPHASRRRRASSRTQRDASQRTSPVSALLTTLVEDLLFEPSFEREATQKEQRELCFVLGQMYNHQYGLPMMPLDDSDSSGDESARPVPTFLSAVDGSSTIILAKLYRFILLCIKGGWVGKAEIRLSLVFLSKSPVFSAAPMPEHVRSLFRHIFTQVDEVSVPGLVRDISDLASQPTERIAHGKVIQDIGQEIFHLLLEQGLPVSDALEDAAVAAAAVGWGSEFTSLSAECDLGPFFLDNRQGTTLDLCLKDLCYNPLRASSWHLLLMVLMEAYNGLMDELQKLLLLDHLPVQCHQCVPEQYLTLFHCELNPPLSSTEDTSLSVWKPKAPVRALAVTQLMAAAVVAMERAGGESLTVLLGPSCALQTFNNAPRSAGATEEKQFAKIAHLLALKNSAFDVFQRAWKVAQNALSGDDGTDVDLLKRARAETYHLVMRNAAKCYAKGAEQCLRFKLSSLETLQADNFFDEDLFALTAAAKLHWETREGAGVSLPALQLCLRAVRQLTVENARHSFSKPVRLSVMYQLSSLSVKASIVLLCRSNVGATLDVEASLTLIEECMQLLLPQRGGNHQDRDCSSNYADCLVLQDRAWSALLAAWAGLRECRRLDAFDFRSVYRVADTIHILATLTSTGELPAPPSWVTERLHSWGVKELGAAAALEELARLFDRKRPQIVAMWCVENAVSPWEKILIRISQFDNLRKKYTDRYLELAVQCVEVEVVLDVTAFALSALKHATAVVLHFLDRAAVALCVVICTLVGPGEEMAESAQSYGQEHTSTKRAALLSGADRMLQMVYELHCHLSGKVPSTTLEELERAMAALFAHSSLQITRAPPMTSVTIDAPSEFLTSGADAVLDMPSSSVSQFPLSDLTPGVSDISLMRTTCLCKWGQLKLPRTELGKRTKGYFVLVNAERAASVSCSASDPSTAVVAEASVASAGLSAHDRAAVEVAMQAMLSTLTGKRSLADAAQPCGSEIEDNATKMVRLV